MHGQQHQVREELQEAAKLQEKHDEELRSVHIELSMLAEEREGIGVELAEKLVENASHLGKFASAG